jgi:segregation and condensation protein B
MIDPKTLATNIEAFLFMEGGSMSLRKLMTLLKVERPALDAGLDELQARLSGGATTLVRTDTEATLALASEPSRAIEKAYKEELARDIGDAGLEVLTIILYRGPSTRAQIDYIRGVNTSSTIRTLLSRGLMERIGNPEDAREYLYRPTTELLAHLGVTSSSALPEYAAIHDELESFERSAKTQQADEIGDNTGTNTAS